MIGRLLRRLPWWLIDLGGRLWSDEGHESPELAAMEGFPEAHCRVVGIRSSGDRASVLLDTGSPDYPYLYGANCYRRDGRWFESGSNNTGGWQQTSHDPDLGTLSFWDDEPPGADMVRVQSRHGLVEAPVQNGAYLFVWFDERAPHPWPRVVATRVNGLWKPV